MEVSTFLDFVTVRFKEKNWRVTAGVRNVSSILARQNKFYSVMDIEYRLVQMGRSIDTVTIYRILEKLNDVGLVNEFESKWHHETDPDNALKGHYLICDKTGWAEEIHLDYFSTIAKQLAKEKGFLLKEVKMAFVGTSDKNRRPEDLSS